MEPMAVGHTEREPKRVIGKSGKAPKGVGTDRSGERARTVTPKKERRGVAGLGTKREIRIMPAFKVPFPKIGDRRALLAPNVSESLRKAKDPRAFRAFAIVEYAGNTCVKVHGATDDARQASALALAVAGAVHKFMQRGAVSAARTSGAYGKPLESVRVYDMTGLGLAPKKTRKPAGAGKDPLKREEPKVYRSTVRSEREQVQFSHQRDIHRSGKCTVCGGKITNVPCGDLEVSEGVKSLRAEIAKENAARMTAALKAAFACTEQDQTEALAVWEGEGGQ